jgi:hypothetical protein
MDGQTVLEDAERVFDLASETMGLGKDELDRLAFNTPRDLLGYVYSLSKTKMPPIFFILNPISSLPKDKMLCLPSLTYFVQTK